MNEYNFRLMTYQDNIQEHEIICTTYIRETFIVTQNIDNFLQ